MKPLLEISFTSPKSPKVLVNARTPDSKPLTSDGLAETTVAEIDNKTGVIKWFDVHARITEYTLPDEHVILAKLQRAKLQFTDFTA